MRVTITRSCFITTDEGITNGAMLHELRRTGVSALSTGLGSGCGFTSAQGGQKFPPGARVRIAESLRTSMKHFPKGVLATVLYTYAHAYGGSDVKSYCLNVDGFGKISWYEEDQLTSVEDEWPDLVCA